MKNATVASCARLSTTSDNLLLEELVRLAGGDWVVTLSPLVKPAGPPKEERNRQIVDKFMSALNLPQMEEDVEFIRDLQAVHFRQNKDEAGEALGRVAELLDDLIDTVESCEVKK